MMMMTHHPPTQQNCTASSPYRHQYSELLVTTTDSSDCSATYTLPVYPGSDGTTYSTTSAIYHQPNCLCHQMACQPPTCQSPAHQSNCTDTSGTSSASTDSSTHQTWVHADNRQYGSRWCQRPVMWAWSSLSLLTFSLCIVCLTQPCWLVNTPTGESLGLLKQNRMDPSSNTVKQISYKESSPFVLPSASWKIALVLYGIATTLLGLSALLALVASAPLLTRVKTRDRVTFCTGFMQLFAVIFLTTSALFYMVGLDADVSRDVCGDSSVFYTGACDIGWNYILLILTCAVGFTLPVLSHYVDHHLHRAMIAKETVTRTT